MDNVDSNKYPLIGIIIINYNGFEDTLECLNSLRKVKYDNYVVIIIDNASQTNELQKLRTEYPLHRFIQSKENYGFSGANNIGIHYALSIGADYILLLNNDTVVDQDFLLKLVQTDLSKNIIVVPEIRFYSTPDRIWMSGGHLSNIRASGISNTKRRSESDKASMIEVSFASGCCVLMSKEVISKIGNWDEEYFLYVEDVDYSFRAKINKIKIILQPASLIYHKIHASSKGDQRLPLYYMVRNRLLFAKKHLRSMFFISFCYIIISSSIKALYWAITKNNASVSYVFLGISDFIKGVTGKRDLKK